MKILKVTFYWFSKPKLNYDDYYDVEKDLGNESLNSYFEKEFNIRIIIF